MSYTYALGLYCRWASLLHMFFYVRLTCGANFWGKMEGYKRRSCSRRREEKNQKRVSFSLSSSRRHGPGELLDRLTSQSSPLAATGRDSWYQSLGDPRRGCISGGWVLRSEAEERLRLRRFGASKLRRRRGATREARCVLCGCADPALPCFGGGAWSMVVRLLAAVD